jgi:hypothetical protein
VEEALPVLGPQDINNNPQSPIVRVMVVILVIGLLLALK